MASETSQYTTSRCQRNVKAKSARRRSTATSAFLTAAALHLAFPCTSDAFVAPSGTRTTRTWKLCGVGPLHVPPCSVASSLSPLCMSASLLLDGGNSCSSTSGSGSVTHQPLGTTKFNFGPVASTVVPSTSFLSSRQNPSSLSIPTASKYGGRASGSSSIHNVEEADKNIEVVGRGAALGFVIVDDRRPQSPRTASRTSLGVSRSTPTPEQSDWTDMPWFEESLDSSDTTRRSDEKASSDDSVATTSPVRRRVAASLLRTSAGAGNGRSVSGSGKDIKERTDTAESSPSVVPAWFPWMPTRSQIETLKMPELCEACVERGLSKNGRKGELQDRLMGWTKEQHRCRVENRRSGMPSGILGSSSAAKQQRTPLDDMIDEALEPGSATGTSSSSSSAGAGDAGIESLFNRRKALRQAKDANEEPPVLTETDDDDVDEDDAPPTEEYLSKLAQTFNSPTAKFSNYEVKEMYQKAKFADQAGDRRQARKILIELLDATPKDSRILRRLARMEVEEGNISGGRLILQNGIRRNPGDANLLHGLATLEAKHGNVDAARGLYKEAIRADPSQPNAYHALGTMEHSSGNIRVATTVLRHGIKQNPTNHRLHHALGDLYREAQMLDLSLLAYRKSLKYSPEWGKSFAYTALSYLAYDKGDRSDCRRWIQESLEVKDGSHSQGWLALAQLEESEGRFNTARCVYDEGLTQYERSRSSRRRSKSLRPSRSGDKWIFVYRSWARMEEHHGTYESANAVYSRATRVYPNHSVLFLGWAKLHAQHGREDRARTLFKISCDKAGSRSAEPYRIYAEFEMSRGDYARAKSVLYLGAQELSESLDVAPKSDELAHLFHTWALCEWHLQNYDRTEKLFDHSLRMTDAGEKGSEVRSLILYSLARFFFDAKHDYVLAQHSICLALKENIAPGRYPDLWRLWADIAEAQGNNRLALRCKEQEREFGQNFDANSDDVSSSSLPLMTAPAMRKMLRKAPWHYKLAGTTGNENVWRGEIVYPQRSVSERKVELT